MNKVITTYDIEAMLRISIGTSALVQANAADREFQKTYQQLRSHSLFG